MRNRYLTELPLFVLIVGLCLTPYYTYAQPPSSLVGKWNFVVSFKNVSISGTVTFAPKTFSETTGGHTISGTYAYAAGVLNYCYPQGCIQYSQAGGDNGMSGMSMNNMNNSNHIEFHAANDIIYHLMR